MDSGLADGDIPLYHKYEETHYQRAYSLDEVERAAREAGMRLEAVYAAFTRKAPAADSEDFNAVFDAGIPVAMYFGDYIDNGDPNIQATSAWQAMRQACYDFEEAYNALGGNCTVVDLPEEGITGNTHFMFQDLNNDVIAMRVEDWISQNVSE